MPRITTSSMFFYVYVMQSLTDNKRYVGYTTNLKRRLEEHEKGLSFATKFRLPFKLIYYEACTHSEDAKRREKYLKTTQGARFLGLRLKCHIRANAFGAGG